MEEIDTGIIFGRPWLKIDTDVLNGFDLGRFGLALLSCENNFIYTRNFSELSFLLSKTNDEFWPLIKSGSIKFLFHPEDVAIVTFDGTAKSIGTIIYPAHAGEFRDTGDYLPLIMESVESNPFFDSKISEEQAKMVSDSTVATDKDLQGSVLRLLAKDLLDIKMRECIFSFFSNYFKDKINYTDLLVVENDGKEPRIRLKPSTNSLSQNNISTFIFMLYQAYFQSAVARFINAQKLFSDFVIFNLGNEILKARDHPVAKSDDTKINTLTRVIEIPDITWLVNRNLLDIKEIIKFKSSKDGKNFKRFLDLFNCKNIQENDKTEKIYKEVIKTFHNHSWKERIWNSKGSKTIRFLVTNGLSLIPPIGSLLGAGSAVVDHGVSKILPDTFRPTLVLENRIKNKLDQNQIALETQRKAVYPSLSKLQKQGYQATMAFKIDDNKNVIILNIPNQKASWEIKIDMQDEYSKEYFNSFKALLPPVGTKERELVDLLGEGWIIKKNIINGNNFKQTTTFSQTYELYKPERQSKSLIGDTKSFFDFTHGRSFLIHPSEYLVLYQKLKGEN